MLAAGTGRDSPGQGTVAEGKAVLLCPQAVCPLILLSSKAAPAFLLPASRTGCARRCRAGGAGEAGEGQRVTNSMPAQPNPCCLHPAPGDGL